MQEPLLKHLVDLGRQFCRAKVFEESSTFIAQTPIDDLPSTMMAEQDHQNTCGHRRANP
jgi:hypothetical protein